MPYLGGLAIVGAFALTVGIAASCARPSTGRTNCSLSLVSRGLAVVGLLDDLRG